MRQGHISEVDELHERPDHPVRLQGGPPGLVEPLLDALTLHGGHAAEEDTNHDGGECSLVASHTSKSLETGIAGNSDLAGQEVEPGGGHRSEDACLNTSVNA